MNPSETAAPVTSAISCRHRSTGHAGRRPGKPPGHAAAARWTGRNPARPPGGPRMHPAAGAPGLVQVVLHPLRRRGRDLLLLIRPGNPQVSGIGQVTAAGAGALGMVILGPVRDLPRHGRPRAARLLPALLLLRPLSSAPLLPRRLPARQVVRARRHRGVPAVPRPRARRHPQLLPKVSDRRLQRGDLPGLRRDQLRLLPDQRITRIHGRLPGRHIGHSPQSSRKPRSPTTATPRPTLERNPRLLAATPTQGPECLRPYCGSCGTRFTARISVDCLAAAGPHARDRYCAPHQCQ